MRKRVKRILWGVLGLLVAVYLGACIWVRANETRLIFPRSTRYVAPPPSLALNQQRLEFGEVDGTKLYAWIVPSLPSDPENNWVLIFHGNGDNVSGGANFYDDWRAMGFNIMAPEYPGYLDSPGTPGEAIIEREARLAYQYLRTVRQVPTRNIVLFGGSLGAAFAIDLATQVEAGALVEHGGFTSIPAVGRVQFPFLPIDLLARTRLESEKKIGAVKMPVLLLHSTEDRVVPFSQAERLYLLAPSPKRLVRLRGPHTGPSGTELLNPRFLSEIATFLSTEGGIHLRQPLPSIAPVIAETMASRGIEPALAQYRSLLAETPRRYKFKEAELNGLGYQLLAAKRVEEAVAVLRLNTEQFPESFNVFDSLGDAYTAAGRDADAFRSYQQSVALWPDAKNPSRPRLEELQRKSGAR